MGRPREHDDATRARLLHAAEHLSATKGFEAITVRAVAEEADTTTRAVYALFGSKEGLFVKAVLQLPFDPAELLDRLADGPADTLGERIVRTFLTIWDATGGGHFTALVRSVSSQEQAAHLLNDFFVKQVFSRIAGSVAPDHAHFRGSLVGSQMVGMGMARYVVKFEPLASADIETMVAAVAPNVQRYLTGDIA